MVISSGKSVSLSWLDSLLGYWGRVDNFRGGGGMVEAGFGDDSANTRAVATASAYVLNLN